MKTFEILSEMPREIGKDAPFYFKIDDIFVSQEALVRTYDLLGNIDINNVAYKTWLSKTKGRSLITTAIPNPDEIPYTIRTSSVSDSPRQLVVVDLHFKNTQLPIRNPLQVDTVSTNTRFTNNGLALMLYVVLARYDYSVISDGTQYNGGIGLWKKIAIESNDRKYVVRIWDKNSNDWLKNQNGEPIKYDGKNLNHESVWNSVTSEPNSWLVLTST